MTRRLLQNQPKLDGKKCVCLCCCVVVVVVEWLYYFKRIIIVRGADLSDFFVDFRR